MKIRIKGNSLRLRLSKTDLKTLEENNAVTDKISFGNTELVYILQPHNKGEFLSAIFENNAITVFIPMAFSSVWNSNEIVSIHAEQDIENEKTLSILVEKDFQCLDKTTEDQSDFFINPHTTCQ